jgi:F-type H+-transporting ATPase subunit b
MDKIAQAEAQALQEVRDQAIEVALVATAKLISENLGPERSGVMIDRAIRNLSGKLH